MEDVFSSQTVADGHVDLLFAHGQLLRHVFSNVEMATSAVPAPLVSQAPCLQVPLPIEVLQHILVLLDPHAAASAASSCLQFYSSSCSSWVWKEVTKPYLFPGLAVDATPFLCSSIIGVKRAALCLHKYSAKYFCALDTLFRLHTLLDASSPSVARIRSLRRVLDDVFTDLRLPLGRNRHKGRARVIQDIASLPQSLPDVAVALMPGSSSGPISLQVELRISEGFYQPLSPLVFSVLLDSSYPAKTDAAALPLTPGLWSPACDPRTKLIQISVAAQAVDEKGPALLSQILQTLASLFVFPSILTQEFNL